MIARTQTMRQRGRQNRDDALQAVARLGLGSMGAGGRRRVNARSGGLLGMELKFLDESGTKNIPCPAGGDYAGAELDPAANCIGCPAQGDGASNRDGRSYVVKSIDIQGSITIPVVANATAGQLIPDFYFALVQDTQSNGAQLNAEDVFINPGLYTNAQTMPLRDMSYITRFKVLDTFRATGQSQPAGFDGTNIEYSGQTIPMKLSWRGAVKVNCSGTTADVAQVQDHSFHLIGVCSTATLAPTLNYSARTRFIG